jgi:hypothetical protein
MGFKIESLPHNINPHIKCRIQPLTLHQYATVSSIWVKVGPTSQTPETMHSLPHLTLNHQLQWREASASTAPVEVVCIAPIILKHASLCILLSLFLALATRQPGDQSEDAKVMNDQ